MDIDAQLVQFDASARTVQACELLLRTVPDPDVPRPVASLDALAERLDASPEQVRQARERLARPEVQRALDAMHALDARDGVASNLAAAASVIAGLRSGSLDTGPIAARQGRDAVHKAFVLAWVVGTLFDGTPERRVAAFLALTTGRALVDLFGIVEVTLPFAAQAEAQAGLLGRLAERYGPNELIALGGSLGDDCQAVIEAMLPPLVPHLDKAVQLSAGQADAVLAGAREMVPLLATVGERAGEVVATGMDLLPAYHYLGNLLVAEVALRHPESPQPLITAPPPLPDDDDLLDAPPPRRRDAALASGFDEAPPPPPGSTLFLEEDDEDDEVAAPPPPPPRDDFADADLLGAPPPPPGSTLALDVDDDDQQPTVEGAPPRELTAPATEPAPPPPVSPPEPPPTTHTPPPPPPPPPAPNRPAPAPPAPVVATSSGGGWGRTLLGLVGAILVSSMVCAGFVTLGGGAVVAGLLGMGERTEVSKPPPKPAPPTRKPTPPSKPRGKRPGRRRPRR